MAVTLAYVNHDADHEPKRTTTELMVEALVSFREENNADGARDQFWQLMQRHRADLINQAFAILGNMADAEDIVQESLCQACEKLETLRDPKKLTSWLRSINRFNALNLFKWRKRQQEKEPELVSPTFSAPETSPSGRNPEVVRRLTNAEHVIRAIESLPIIHREIVVLRYWEHLSYEDISEKLEIPIGTVKSRLARADKTLALTLRRLWSEE